MQCKTRTSKHSVKDSRLYRHIAATRLCQSGQLKLHWKVDKKANEIDQWGKATCHKHDSLSWIPVICMFKSESQHLKINFHTVQCMHICAHTHITLQTYAIICVF